MKSAVLVHIFCFLMLAMNGTACKCSSCHCHSTQEHYGEKADVWSLGCVLYHIMMLRPPFDGTNPLSVASKICEGSYDPVGDPPGGVSYSLHLKQLVRAMMTVDQKRWGETP